MSAYLLGLATLPAVVLLGLLLAVLLAPPSWTWYGCVVGTGCTREWHRAAHPRRPWWVWHLAMKTHRLTRADHRAASRRWRAARNAPDLRAELFHQHNVLVNEIEERNALRSASTTPHDPREDHHP